MNSLRMHTSSLGVLGVVLLLLSGCAASKVVTRESGLGQELVYRSLERAVNELDVTSYGESKITVKLYTQTGHRLEEFSKEYVVARLKERGLHIVSNESEADDILEVFISVLGINEDGTLLGLPALPVSMYGLSTPELALYKSTRDEGQAEIQVYTFDARTGAFISKTGTLSGGAFVTKHRLLLFINFTRTDLEE